MRRSSLAFVATFTGMYLGLAATAHAFEALPKSYTCLPDETVLVVRVPEGAAVAEEIESRTKLGAMLADSGRFERLGQLLQASAEGRGQWEEVLENLGKYKLQPRDLGTLFDGELGFGIAIEPGFGLTPIATVYTWCEPADDLTDRLYAAIQQLVEEDSDRVKRADIDMAGASVMHLTIHNDPRELRGDGEDAEGAQAPASDEHVFITKLGRRLLASFVITSMSDAVEHIDEIAERLEQNFGRFLGAHQQPHGRDPQIMQTPGMAAALPSGTPVVEVMADPRPLVKYFFDVAEKANEDHRESAQQSVKLVKSLGIDTLGPVAYRMALEGNVLASGLFASLPVPRSGIFALLDQPELAAEPPAWVSSSIVSFEQASFDVAKAYARIKHLVIEHMGAQAGAAFDLVEGQLSQQLQVDANQLLGSLGQRHMALSFEPRATAQEREEDETVAGRTGLVWQVKDEAAWRRVLQVAATMSGQEPIEEQGFLGLRVSQPQFEGGAFVGRGFLIIGAGDDVIESMLSMIRKPPEGEASLRGSALYRRASELLRPEPCLTYQLTDNNRNIKAARQIVVNSMEAMKEKAADDEDVGNLQTIFGVLDPALIDKLMKLLPSEDELDGAIGVGVAQTKVNDSGIVARSIVELPPRN